MIGVQCFQPALLEYLFPQYPQPAAEQMVERGVYRYMPRFLSVGINYFILGFYANFQYLRDISQVHAR